MEIIKSIIEAVKNLLIKIACAIAIAPFIVTPLLWVKGVWFFTEQGCQQAAEFDFKEHNLLWECKAVGSSNIHVWEQGPISHWTPPTAQSEQSEYVPEWDQEPSKPNYFDKFDEQNNH